MQRYQNDIMNKKLLLNAILRSDFESFIEKVFNTVSPNNVLQWNWHINAISHNLHCLVSGRISRLIINIPPRYLKSIIVSVAWPAFLLGCNPNLRIIVVSYSNALSIKHSLDTRDVMNSLWYRELFPNVRLKNDQNEKNKFYTTQHGFRFATSVNSTLTGEGGDIIIIDDPHNPNDIESEIKRTSIHRWFENVLISRLNNRKTSSIVVVMQRLHDDDLTGYLLRKFPDLWNHLNLPIISKENEEIPINPGLQKRFIGDILHPERDGYDEIKKIKIEIGSHAFAAQYQQSPIKSTSQFINLEWLQRYENMREGTTIQSWDTAISDSDTADYSVCSTWSIMHGGLYLLDIERNRLQYSALKKLTISQWKKWNASVILIENKASGQQLIQELNKNLPIISINPLNDKLSRFVRIIPIIESKRIFLPREAHWLREFESELLLFPKSRYDDQVDSMMQFLEYQSTKHNNIYCRII